MGKDWGYRAVIVGCPMPRRFASHRLLTTLPVALAMAALLVPRLAFSAAAPSPALTFEKDIRAIFKTNCFQCHGEDGVRKAGLDVRLKRFLEKGMGLWYMQLKI